jgi:hypothetical protein
MRLQANNSQQTREDILLTDFVSFCGFVGLEERNGGEVELARGLRHETPLREKGGERIERDDGKAAGGRARPYTWRRVGLADGARDDAILNAAGGEGSQGATRLEGVIHGNTVLGLAAVLDEDWAQT